MHDTQNLPHEEHKQNESKGRIQSWILKSYCCILSKWKFFLCLSFLPLHFFLLLLLLLRRSESIHIVCFVSFRIFFLFPLHHIVKLFACWWRIAPLPDFYVVFFPSLNSPRFFSYVRTFSNDINSWIRFAAYGKVQLIVTRILNFMSYLCDIFTDWHGSVRYVASFFFNDHAELLFFVASVWGFLVAVAIVLSVIFSHGGEALNFPFEW